MRYKVIKTSALPNPPLGIIFGNYIPVVHENLIYNLIFVNNRIMKMLKKILAILISALMLCSCAYMFYRDYKPVNDYDVF